MQNSQLCSLCKLVFVKNTSQACQMLSANSSGTHTRAHTHATYLRQSHVQRSAPEEKDVVMLCKTEKKEKERAIFRWSLLISLERNNECTTESNHCFSILSSDGGAGPLSAHPSPARHWHPRSRSKLRLVATAGNLKNKYMTSCACKNVNVFTATDCDLLPPGAKVSSAAGRVGNKQIISNVTINFKGFISEIEILILLWTWKRSLAVRLVKISFCTSNLASVRQAGPRAQMRMSTRQVRGYARSSDVLKNS